ncbi:MAG: HAMP domain-containing histidine kinase [Thermus sp.]|uniref:sensor histidine kinase n=1 Tax=Thermus sp. TaxID=275 RepID=UPI0025F6F3A4|nr:HAMP domain-containing sensor histidine kinase [Thermus sp.]MCS6867141.1 HAMP domain-containing histidine kinase [Thermus sp.]MCS7218239.1 HAMP domain-containing histidine kinase [Thermus sp.]MDW8356318.1 HAMP domain-containing sensor histidine kinase [Thermus sp.]
MKELLAEAWEEALEGLILHQRREVVYLNPAAAQLLGVNRERVVGRPLLLALRDHRLEALALHGGERTLEVRGRWLRARALPGRLYLLDETEAHQRLLALEEATQTLAHELRTPLSGMGPLLEALTPRTAQEREVLDLLKGEVARLSRLVRDLTPHQPGPKRTFPLEELWPRLEALLRERLKGRQVAVDLPHTAHTDPEALLQILLNLLENALKYGQDPIRLLSWEGDGRLHLEVRDQGPGLPEYESLFLPGRRGPVREGGQGLGLYLVRRLARGLGGEAYALRAGRENVFGVWIPLH